MINNSIQRRKSPFFTTDWDNYNNRSNFGMDYATPGQLGGLGQGYVQPNLMYFGSELFTRSLYQAIRSDPELLIKLNKEASQGNFKRFNKTLNQMLTQR